MSRPRSLSAPLRARTVATEADDVFGVPLVEMVTEDTSIPAIATLCMQAIEDRGADGAACGLAPLLPSFGMLFSRAASRCPDSLTRCDHGPNLPTA